MINVTEVAAEKIGELLAEEGKTGGLAKQRRRPC